MSDSYADKTEAPTPKRLEQAREQGNIPRSPDLTAAVLLIAMLMLLKWYGDSLIRALRVLLETLLSAESLARTDSLGSSDQWLPLLATVGLGIAPLFAGVLLVAVAVNIAQVGFRFSTKRLQPNLAALNPLKGLSRIFSGGGGPVKLLMDAAKMIAVALVAYSAVHDRMTEIVMVQQLAFQQIFLLGSTIIYDIALRIGVLLLVLALADYMYQRWRINRELRMTKQEVKDEMRSVEGDPQVKSRRRQIARQMIEKRLKATVPTADVIVTNPTEFAVVLKYDPGAMHAPRVVAKGQDLIARRIRELAVEHGIPILERKPLARALYRLVEVGQEIPEQFYTAVAEILAYVYELSGKGSGHSRSGAR